MSTIEIQLEEIKNKVYETHEKTVLIEQACDYMQESQAEHKAEMHEAKEDIDSLKADMNKAKGGVKLLMLISLIAGIAVALMKVQGVLG